MSRTGLRARLALALAGVALGAVGLATLLANAGLERELGASAERRVDDAATHLARVAADMHERDGRLTGAARRELGHLGAVDGLSVSVTREPVPTGLARRAPIVVDGREVGALVVAPLDEEEFRAADRELHDRLNRLHLVAALAAALLALLAAAILATRLARPLRRMTESARHIEQGALETRIDPAGGAELEQLAHALNGLAATLQREARLRHEATADLEHELRTPLTGIRTRIEAAQDGVLPDSAANLAAMHDEALRLEHLVDDLARLSDAQEFQLRAAQTVDLGTVVRRCAASAAAAAEDGEVRIDIDIDLAPVAVRGDGRRLEQVVQNLVDNAVRYTEPGGTIRLRVKRAGQEALLEVADTGIGIAAQDLPHVFERFWRSDRSRARASGGAGIGLAIVRELVGAHDGCVEVTSEAGRGSRFTVRLPLAEAGAAPPFPSRASTVPEE